MLRWLWWLGIAACLGSISGCLLPEVTIDETLAPPPAAMDPMADPAEPTGGGADEAEKERLCSPYCERFLRLCASHPANTYSDQRDCELTCLISGEWPLGTSNETPNSVRCREYHSILAMMDPTTHCYHAAEFPSMGFCELLGASSPP